MSESDVPFVSKRVHSNEPEFVSDLRLVPKGIHCYTLRGRSGSDIFWQMLIKLKLKEQN